MIYKIKRYKGKAYKYKEKVIDKFKEKAKYGIPCEFFISSISYEARFSSNFLNFLFVKPEEQCGKIIDISDECVTVEIPDTHENAVLLNILELDSENVFAYLRGCGYKENNELVLYDIITFDIVYKGDKL